MGRKELKTKFLFGKVLLFSWWTLALWIELDTKAPKATYAEALLAFGGKEREIINTRRVAKKKGIFIINSRIYSWAFGSNLPNATVFTFSALSLHHHPSSAGNSLPTLHLACCLSFLIVFLLTYAPASFPFPFFFFPPTTNNFCFCCW